MIKSALLKQKCKKLAKQPQAEHLSYRKASNIGILYNSQEFGRELIDELADSIKGDGKELLTLAFTEKESGEKFSFCRKDVSVSGNLMKKPMGLFTNQAFDFLISLDTSGDINYKYVLALSKAACKVGITTDTYKDLLLMSIKPSSTDSEGMKDIVKYLKMI